MLIIFDNVDFNYPAFGGMEIKKGRKWMHFTQFSNYPGDRTHAKGKVLVDSTAGGRIVSDILHGNTEDIESYVSEWYGGFEVR